MFMQIYRAFWAFLLTCTLNFMVSPLFSAENPEYVASLQIGLQEMREGKWDVALLSAGAAGTIRRDIIEWHRLRASHGTFGEAQAFLQRRGNWPGEKLLRKRSEASIPQDADTAQVLAFFADQPPQTGHGALIYAQALTRSGKVERAAEQAILAWFSLPMQAEEEAALLATYGDTLKDYHWARLDMLLWQGETTAAKRALVRVDTAHQALATARIALRNKTDGVNALIDAVPAVLADDPGLAYERFNWRASKGRNQDAIDLLLARSVSADSLGEPARYGSWRRTLARWSMRNGNSRQAYRLAANHHISEGSNRNDLEWIAGYVALRQLDDPATALKHFQAFRDGVDTPISLGRAGYWLGRSYEALGQEAKAQEAYRVGAQHQTSFYGQLSAEKAGVAMDPALTGQETFSGWQDAGFWNDSNMIAARLLEAAGERYLALRFTQHLSERLTRAEVGQMTAWAEATDAPYLQVKLAKYVLKRGLLLERPYFALTTLGAPHQGVSQEYSLSIARRESEFNPTVQSGVGARGMMQLMPQTAKDMADTLGLGFSKDRLLSDPEYNIRLGTEYLAYLRDNFGKNPVLIAVAYNAGPGRARSWSERRGHPGAASVDVVDWIEHIPFRETRNYVMRVTESLAVYRARLSGKTAQITLMQELNLR